MQPDRGRDPRPGEAPADTPGEAALAEARLTGYLASFEPAMRLALEEARAAGTSADVPVGAVILDPSGGVIARGRNRREADGDPTAHAEIVAIRAAARAAGQWRLDGCTVVVTLEPCTMCAGAICAARISRLVFAAPDPRAGAVGSLWDVVRDPRVAPWPEVIGGVLAAESLDIIRTFFTERR
jgi:tRNA(adenine34) deaminase